MIFITKKALIIGINSYPTSPLLGRVNDANDWQTTLTAKGFAVSKLLDSQATKANIMSGLTALLAGAKLGDSLAFCFSGHGSRLADVSGDESDGYDEVICPVDFPAAYITDDEVRAKLSGLPVGVNFDIFLDMCYAGTGTRAMVAVKIPELYSGEKIVPIAPSAPTRSLVIVPGMNHCLWAACKDSELSIEANVNGIRRGLFSYYAAKAMRLYGSTYTRSALIQSIENAVKAANPSQTPQLECTTSESLQKPFT